MQVQKAKKGYKLVKSLFGKYEEIPEDWELETLGNLCEIRKENDVNSKLYVGLEHISQGTNLLVGRGDVDQFTSTKNIFKKGDVLYGKLRPLLNKVWLAVEDGYCSTDILPLKVKEKLDNRILVKLLTSQAFVLFASSTSAGTKMPRTNWSDIQTYEIKLPPLKEQQKIASILSNVDSLIQQTQKEIEQTQRLKKGLMQRLLTRGIGHTKFKKVKRMLSKEIEIPLDWKIKNLDEISDVIDPWPSHRAPSEKENGIPYLGIGDFDEDGNIIGISRYVDNSVFEKQKQIFNLEKGDLAIGRVASIGKIVKLNTSFNYTISPTLSIIKPKIMSSYLVQTLKSDYFQQELMYNIKGSTRSSVGIQLIRKLKILIPSKEEQQEIASILSNVDSKIQKQQEYKSKLETLKKGLMQKLLTGQIRVKV